MLLSAALSLALATQPLELVRWNEKRLTTQRAALWTLGAWAAGNMIAGGLGVALERDERLRFLHLGNLAWNVVNLALAGVGLLGEARADPAGLDARKSLDAVTTAERTYWINGGLDLLYLGAAAFMWQRGELTGDPRLVGLGQALVIQGAFLLVFDVTLAILHLRLHGELADGLTLSVSPAGVAGTF